MTLFVCNTGTELSDNYMTQDMVRNRKLSFPQVSVAITASGGKFPYEFNTIDGTVHEIPYHYEDGKYIFDTSFDELQSRLFVLSSEKMPNTSMLNKINASIIALNNIEKSITIKIYLSNQIKKQEELRKRLFFV